MLNWIETTNIAIGAGIGTGVPAIVQFALFRLQDMKDLRDRKQERLRSALADPLAAAYALRNFAADQSSPDSLVQDVYLPSLNIQIAIGVKKLQARA